MRFRSPLFGNSGADWFNTKGEPKMPRIRFRVGAIALAGLCLTAAAALGADSTTSLKKGTPDLKSAGPLAFGPDGILFVGDTKGAALFAIDTGDHAAAAEKAPGARSRTSPAKSRRMLGTDSKQIMINDLAVNPQSGNVYLSVSRGRGPDATPVLVRVNADGKTEEVSLENVPFAKAEIPNAPSPNAQATTRPSPRSQSITDLSFADGRVFVAGLSNEEFSSTVDRHSVPVQQRRHSTGRRSRSITARTASSRPSRRSGPL